MMEQLRQEIEANFAAFQATNMTTMGATAATLAGLESRFLESYRRLTTLNAWRTELLEPTISAGSLGFFLEAQNDALTSHVLARLGSWRSALQSLRSCIENTLFCLYYKDHPVELQQWHDGRHRLTFTDMKVYFESHPSLDQISPEDSGLTILAEQYSVLSRAVHASAKTFRMSVEGVGVQLWAVDKARLGRWLTNEKAVVFGLNRLLVVLLREAIQQARLPNLRKSISLVIAARYHASIREKVGVSLFT